MIINRDKTHVEHLKTYHPSNYTESMKMRATTSYPRRPTAAVSSTSGAVPKQQSIVSSFASVAPYDKQSKRSKDKTNAVSYCIAKDMMPMSTVEKDGFKKLINVLDQRYNLPGRKYFSKTALPCPGL